MAKLVVVGFKKDMYRASEVLNQLQSMNDDWVVDLHDAVYRDYNGKLRVDQSYQMTTGEGAAWGGFMGSLIGLTLAATIPLTGTRWNLNFLLSPADVGTWRWTRLCPRLMTFLIPALSRKCSEAFIEFRAEVWLSSSIGRGTDCCRECRIVFRQFVPSSLSFRETREFAAQLGFHG
jgi:hypothetical protein